MGGWTSRSSAPSGLYRKATARIWPRLSWMCRVRSTADPETLKEVQGYLAHVKTLTPLGPPSDPRHRPTVGSKGDAFSHERGTPAGGHGRKWASRLRGVLHHLDFTGKPRPESGLDSLVCATWSSLDNGSEPLLTRGGSKSVVSHARWYVTC